MDAGTLFGTVGTGILLVAFVASVSGLLPVNRLYAALNAGGAGLAAYAAFLIDFPPFLILEAVWCVAALAKMVSLTRSRSPQT